MTKRKELSSATLLVGSFMVIYFISYLTRLNFNAVIAEIVSIGVMSKTDAGLVGTALFVAYGVGQLISGFLGDKIKPQLIIGFGLGLTCICNLVLPFLPSVTLYIVVWGVNGFAQAMIWPPIVKMLTEYLDGNGYSKACAKITMSSQFSTIIIYIMLVPLCIRFLDWRSAFWIPSVSAAAVLIAWYFVCRKLGKSAAAKPIREVEEKKQESVPQGGSFAHTMLAAGLPLILVAIVLQGFLRDGLTSWTPTFLTEAFGLSADSAIALNVIIPIFGMLAIHFSGVLFRRVFRNEMTLSIVFFGISAIACIPLVIFCRSNAVVSLVCIALVTALMHGINLMLIGYVPRHFGKYGKASTASGITNAFTYIGSAASSYGFAALSDSIGWSNLVLIWCGICLLGVVAVAAVTRRWSRFADEKISIGRK